MAEVLEAVMLNKGLKAAFVVWSVGIMRVRMLSMYCMDLARLVEKNLNHRCYSALGAAS